MMTVIMMTAMVIVMVKMIGMKMPVMMITIMTAMTMVMIKIVKITVMSCRSEEWSTIPAGAVQRVNIDDGEFWISLPDFLTYFSQTTICSLTPDFDSDGCSDSLGEYTCAHQCTRCLRLFLITVHSLFSV